MASRYSGRDAVPFLKAPVHGDGLRRYGRERANAFVAADIADKLIIIIVAMPAALSVLHRLNVPAVFFIELIHKDRRRSLVAGPVGIKSGCPFVPSSDKHKWRTDFQRAVPLLAEVVALTHGLRPRFPFAPVVAASERARENSSARFDSRSHCSSAPRRPRLLPRRPVGAPLRRWGADLQPGPVVRRRGLEIVGGNRRAKREEVAQRLRAPGGGSRRHLLRVRRKRLSLRLTGILHMQGAVADAQASPSVKRLPLSYTSGRE